MSLLGIILIAMALKIFFGDPKYSDGTPPASTSPLGWLFGIEDVPEGTERMVRFGEDALAWFQSKTTRDP